MTQNQWEAFCEFRETYRACCGEWSALSGALKDLQKAAAEKDTPEYAVENSVVYNTAYDKISREDDIHLIVIGDNPGKEEQRADRQSYLVGQSGRLAEGFFKRNPELKTDFRRNVIICNKTPVHTAKTNHLKYLMRNGPREVCDLIMQSQVKCAELIADLHHKLIRGAEKGSFIPELWLVGYAELKGRGLFIPYRDSLKNRYQIFESKDFWSHVYVYQHFSMNRFSLDLKDFMRKNEGMDLERSLKALGCLHKEEIFGPLEHNVKKN